MIANTVLTPAEAARLFFDPAPGFVGTANFGYTATDNSGLISNTATYNLPVVNTPPTAVNINTTFTFNGPAGAIVPLSGNDIDGTVTTFNLTSLPTAAQGILSVSCPPNIAGASACAAGFQNLTASTLTTNGGSIALTPTQAATIKFAAGAGFSGIVPFTYTTTDNNSNISTPAIYNITISNQPPISNDITVPVMPNTNGATAITALSSSDPDGTIASYTILSLPPATSGTLIISCGPTPAGATCTAGFANIDAAVLAANPSGISLTATQIASLQFDPAANYTGVVNFTYNAIDNSGNVSNIANYNIPISGVGNLPPVAQNVQVVAMPNTNGQTAILPLVGSDPDGTIANFTVTTIPPASQGVLFYNNGTGIVALIAGTVLTPAQAGTLLFDPAPGFTGNVTFTYFDTDNTGNISNDATYSIPVTGTPPVSTPILAAAMPQTSGPTSILGLISTDADGTIASYFIEKLPPVSQGVLSLLCPPTLIGATCTGSGYQDLTDAILANYPNGGIPLTATQMGAMKFDPAGSYSGNVVFNYHATDNSGLLSNSTTYTIPVTGLPPVSINVVATKMLNTNGSTLISPLNSTDADGTIANYIINSIPPASQGILYYNNGTGLVPVTVGVSLTPAQAATLQFDPTAGFNGNAVFNYTAFDNNGNISNVATYTIPTGSASVLPFSTLELVAQRSGNNIELKWTSKNEISLDRYEIEYSTTQNNFTKAGFKNALNGLANSYENVLYNFTLPVYYIRLKAIDADGKFSYSNIVIVKLSVKNNILVYPTPANAFVNIEFGSNATDNYKLQLIDITGRVLRNELVQPGNIYKLQRKNLATGMYNLRIQNLQTGETKTEKIIFD